MGRFGYSRSAGLARVPSAHVDHYPVHNLCTADVAVGSGFSPYGKAYGQQTSVDVGVADAGEAGYTIVSAGGLCRAGVVLYIRDLLLSCPEFAHDSRGAAVHGSADSTILRVPVPA